MSERLLLYSAVAAELNNLVPRVGRALSVCRTTILSRIKAFLSQGREGSEME